MYLSCGGGHTGPVLLMDVPRSSNITGANSSQPSVHSNRLRYGALLLALPTPHTYIPDLGAAWELSYPVSICVSRRFTF